MDEIIIQGYTRLIELIKTTDASIDDRSAVIRSRDAELLGEMGRITGPVIKTAGISLLERGKKDIRPGSSSWGRARTRPPIARTI